MNRIISSMMTKQTVSVAMDESITQVENVLRSNNLSAVPVLERPNGAVLGIISLRDLAHFHFEKKDGDAVHAWEICSYKPLEVKPDALASEVARMMLSRGVHHILVTENRAVVGIVSALDFVRQFIDDGG